MKIYETITTTSSHKVCREMECDLCGKKTDTDAWGDCYYNVEDTDIMIKIKHRTGMSYPECSDIDIYEIDICPECFQKKLIPWIKSQGGNVTKTEEWF